MTDRIYPVRLPRPATALGYDGTDFHALKIQTDGRLIVKQSSPLGWSATVCLSVEDTNLGAGTQSLDTSGVAAGELWIVQNVSILVNSSTVNRMIAAFRQGTTSVYMMDLDTIRDNRWEAWQGQVILQENDIIRGQVWNATAGDDLKIHILYSRVILPI